jgi:hypothetical protein
MPPFLGFIVIAVKIAKVVVVIVVVGRVFILQTGCERERERSNTSENDYSPPP